MQINDLVKEDIQITLIDIAGKEISKTKNIKGSTIAYFDIKTLYNGNYFVTLWCNGFNKTHKIVVSKK